MSGKTMSDFFDGTTVADYGNTLIIKPMGKVTEEGFKNQVIHIADDNSEERITLTTGSMFYVSWSWEVLSEDEAGLVMDFYHDPNKANGIGRTFKWLAHDTNTYVARFDCKLPRSGQNLDQWGYPEIRLRVLGVSV